MLLSSIWEKLNRVIDLDDPRIWAQCLHEWAKFFKQAMHMAMKNLSIVQHRDTLRYVRIHRSIYQPWFRRFSKEDYVYLQHNSPTTLDAKQGIQSFVWMITFKVTFYNLMGRMDKTVESILKIAFIVMFPFKGPCGGASRFFLVLFIVRRKMLQLCCSMRTPNEVDMWHA